MKLPRIRLSSFRVPEFEAPVHTATQLLRPRRPPPASAAGSNPAASLDIDSSCLAQAGVRPEQFLQPVPALLHPGERQAKIGDRMMVHHYQGCSQCSHCRSGWQQLCQEVPVKVYGNIVTFRDLDAGSQEEVPLDGLAERLKNLA